MEQTEPSRWAATLKPVLRCPWGSHSSERVRTHTHKQAMVVFDHRQREPGVRPDKQSACAERE
jgi:hypothetical protein